MSYVQIMDLVAKRTSSLKVGGLAPKGKYPAYGAQGVAGLNNSFQTDVESIAVIKDGAGVGRVQRIPANSSVIGAMQLLVPKSGNDVDYLFYLFKYLDFGHSFNGATIPHIYFKDYGKRVVRENDHASQKRIASSLDGISSAIQNCRDKLTGLDNLVKSRFIERRALA